MEGSSGLRVVVTVRFNGMEFVLQRVSITFDNPAHSRQDVDNYFAYARRWSASGDDHPSTVREDSAQSNGTDNNH